MAAVVVVPGSLEAGAGLLERVVGLRRASARAVKGAGQIGNLQWAARLQAGIDRPGVATGLGDQRLLIYIRKSHSTARGRATLDASPATVLRAFPTLPELAHKGTGATAPVNSLQIAYRRNMTARSGGT